MAFDVSKDIFTYRDFIRTSYGELSVAKHTYVHTNSGWFSDRSQCYLACGRPVIVQDTGFSQNLPSGRGLFAFKSVDEAKNCIEEVQGAYEDHRVWAREVASEHFSSDVVLAKLLKTAMSASGPN